MADKQFSKTCFDASVVVKLLTKEKDSDTAAFIFKQFLTQNIPLVEPGFLKIEVYSVLRKKTYLGKISEKQTQSALSLLKEINFDYINEDENLLLLAYQLAKKLKQPVIYDCLYLALAKQEKAAFITADLKFLKIARTIYKDSFFLKIGQSFVKENKVC